MNRLIKYFSENGKKVFLIDSIGACMSALVLLLIVQPFNVYFGIPEKAVTALFLTASFICMYSAACFLLVKKQFALFMRSVGTANLTYCVLIIALFIYYYAQLTVTGILYFLIEAFIICTLGYAELKAAKAAEKSLRQVKTKIRIPN